jgi:hypothetical protein
VVQLEFHGASRLRFFRWALPMAHLKTSAQYIPSRNAGLDTFHPSSGRASDMVLVRIIRRAIIVATSDGLDCAVIPA